MSAIVLAAIAGPLIGLSIVIAFWFFASWNILGVVERVYAAVVAFAIGAAGWAILVHALNLEAAGA